MRMVRKLIQKVTNSRTDFSLDTEIITFSRQRFFVRERKKAKREGEKKRMRGRKVNLEVRM